MPPTVLVLGGGRSALEAAKEVVAQGGRAVLLVPNGVKKACALRVPSGIETIVGAELVKLEGSPGRFTAHLTVDGDELIIGGDAVLVADDAPPSEPTTIGPMGLEETLANEQHSGLRRVAMVLGPYASRAAHVRALELALALRSQPGQPEVTVFTKEVLAHGTDELTYAKAQGAGVRFVRNHRPPTISRAPALCVAAVDQPSGLEVVVSPDLLVVEGPVPEMPPPRSYVDRPVGERAWTGGTVSMGPVTSLREGVFLCRAGDRDLLDDELLVVVRAAATRAMTLALDPVARAPAAAQVDRDKCSACLTCVRSCPFHAPRIDDEGKAVVDGDLCQACGICVAACPSRALSLPSDLRREETISSMFQETDP